MTTKTDAIDKLIEEIFDRLKDLERKRARLSKARDEQREREIRIDELKKLAQLFLGDPRKTIRKEDLRGYIQNALDTLTKPPKQEGE